MFASLLFMASGLAPPEIDTNFARRVQSLFPSWAARAGNSAGIEVRLVVEPDGKVRECRLEGIVGNRRLAEEVCTELSTLRMTTATGPDGNPSFAIVRTYFQFLVNGDERAQVERYVPAPFREFAVAGLPESPGRRISLALNVAIAGNGALSLCQATSGSSAPGLAPLVRAACRQLEQDSFDVLAGADGNPVSYVTTVNVNFVPAAT